MGKLWALIFQVLPIRWVLLHLPVLWEIDKETHVFLIWWGTPWDGDLMRKKHPYYGKSMSINFPEFCYTMSFVAFSRTVGNVCGNRWISHMLKYTIRWKSNEKKAAILWEKYEHQFSRLFPCHGFCCIFSYCGKFTGKPIHFPYSEVYHRMGIG